MTRSPAALTAAAIAVALTLATTACTQQTDQTPPTQAASATPPVEQTAELSFAPAPVAQSAEGVDGLTPASVHVSPGAEGQMVALQRRDGDAWEDVGTAPQDDTGKADFAVATDHEPARFRAVVLSDEGVAVAQSKVVRAKTRAPRWRDEFNGAELDPEKWAPRLVGLRNEKGHRDCAESLPSAVTVGGGMAHLLVRQIPEDIAEQEDQVGDCPHGEFYNGHIGTEKQFSFTYGILAARIQFPHAQGQHGAFWSQPRKGGAGAGVEIDVIEYFGDNFPAKGDLAGSNAIQHTIYWREDDEQQKVGGLLDVRHLLADDRTPADDFHVYSVEWTPTEYVFRVDGHETFRTSEGVSGVKQYLILSLLTSDWELPRLDTSDLSPMSVDWVRVWNLPKQK